MSNVSNLNCILILDDSIKSKMKSNISDLTMYGVEIIDDVRHISHEMRVKTDKVIILGNYKTEGLDDVKLYKDLLDLDLYLITDDKLVANLMHSLCKCYVLDYTSLTSNLIYSVLYEDTGEQKRYELSSNYLLKSEYVKQILHNSNDGVIQELCEDYLKLRELLEDKLRLETKYQESIRTLESQILRHLSEIDVVSKSFENLVEKVLNQKRVLKDYEKVLSSDFYEKVPLSKYKSRPKILYFKEYQDLIHEHSFITTLVNAIKLQGGMSCKVVRLHDSSDLFRIKTLEDTYTLVNSEFLESTIIKSDAILSYGNYMKLFDLLLTNKYTLDVLIIIDCKKYNDIVLTRGDTIYFNLCRSIRNRDILGLNELYTVVNNGSSPLSWDTYTDYDNFTTEMKRFEFLSSRDVIRRIYRLVKDS